jgi:DNA-binding transcriptional MerR regulator
LEGTYLKESLDLEWVELIRQAREDGFSIEELHELFTNHEKILDRFIQIQNEINNVIG